MNNENALVAKAISKQYVGVQALDNVDVTIKKGEIKCLAGENGCGKSTFVKIIAGIEPATSGQIEINGVDCTDKMNPIFSIESGIQVIYQDLSLFDSMTVAENISMNKLIKEHKKVVGKKEANEIAKKALELINVDIPLDVPVQELSIANRQLVAICRALTLDAKLLFMDEPTTALTKNEVDRLLEIVLELKRKEIAVVFISHKLDEVLKISDSITVLRDGKLIGDFDSKEMDAKKLAYYMTGREVEWKKYKREGKEEAPLLEIQGLTKKGNYNNIDLKIRKGDILGLTGLLGAGRTELALSLFGLNRPDSGKIFMDGKEVHINSTKDALNLGIGLVPEERATQGLFLQRSVDDNISAAILGRLKKKFGGIDFAKKSKLAEKGIQKFGVKTSSADTRVGSLSGGNQQKVVISKWDATEPKLFILDAPTVGVDIGSKAEIYEHIQSFAKSGMAVIIISDEIEEIVANCNRAVVLFDGEKVKEYDEAEMHNENISQEIAELVESGRKQLTGGAK